MSEELRDRLNYLSDRLTQRILEEEGKLKEMGLGVQTWIKTTDNLEIGYSRLNGTWRLCVREIGGVGTWPLADAPRAYRLHGLKHLSELRAAMMRTAEALADRMERFLNGQDDDKGNGSRSE